MFPTQRSLAAAIRGLASLRKIEGYGNASVSDLVAVRLWEAGGAALLATGQWLAVFAGWTLATFFCWGWFTPLVRLLDDRRSRAILLKFCHHPCGGHVCPAGVDELEEPG